MDTKITRSLNGERKKQPFIGGGGAISLDIINSSQKVQDDGRKFIKESTEVFSEIAKAFDSQYGALSWNTSIQGDGLWVISPVGPDDIGVWIFYAISSFSIGYQGDSELIPGEDIRGTAVWSQLYRHTNSDQDQLILDNGEAPIFCSRLEKGKLSSPDCSNKGFRERDQSLLIAIDLYYLKKQGVQLPLEIPLHDISKLIIPSMNNDFEVVVPSHDDLTLTFQVGVAEIKGFGLRPFLFSEITLNHSQKNAFANISTYCPVQNPRFFNVDGECDLSKLVGTDESEKFVSLNTDIFLIFNSNYWTIRCDNRSKFHCNGNSVSSATIKKFEYLFIKFPKTDTSPSFILYSIGTSLLMLAESGPWQFVFSAQDQNKKSGGENDKK